MSKDEVKELLITIVCCFPSFKPDDITETIDTWHKHLKDIGYAEADAELNWYIQNNKGGFPPSVSNLIPKNHAHGYSERIYTDEFYEELEREAQESLIKGRKA